MSIDNSPEHDAENTEAGQQLTPGQYLKQQREGRQLSQKEVADQLHITVHYVNSLEQDAYEKLPGAIFAKGYTKRYAEILELDVDSVMMRFDEHQYAQLNQENEVTRISRRKNQARNRNFAIVSVLLFAGLFTGLWAWNRFVNQAETGQGETGSVVDTANSTEQNSPAAVSNGPAGIAGAVVSEPDTSSQRAPAQRINGVQSAPPEPMAANTEIPAPTEQEQAPTSAEIIAIINEGNDVLRVSFTDESFIQVSDASANRIYRGTLGKGDVLEITDSAPFNILIGDAPLTRLVFNGNEIDVSESIRIDNSARLTVGL